MYIKYTIEPHWQFTALYPGMKAYPYYRKSRLHIILYFSLCWHLRRRDLSKPDICFQKWACRRHSTTNKTFSIIIINATQSQQAYNKSALWQFSVNQPRPVVINYWKKWEIIIEQNYTEVIYSVLFQYFESFIVNKRDVKGRVRIVICCSVLLLLTWVFSLYSKTYGDFKGALLC